MNYSSESKIKRIIWIFMIFIIMFILLCNISNPWIPLFLSGILLLSVTIRNIFIYPASQLTILNKVILYLEIILILLININDSSGYSHVFYFALIADSIITFSYLFGVSVTVMCFIAHLIDLQLKNTNLNSIEFINSVKGSFFLFFIFLLFVCLTKYEMNQRKKVSNMMYDLKLKTKKLEDAYIKLRDNTGDIEDITILKERNRIAREIHDTMGHTLTSVLIELEAGERLLKHNQELAAEKIKLAKEQVRRGLADIRESVGVLNKGKEIVDFISSIKLLLEEIAEHGDIFVRYEISELPPLTEMQEKALFRALQEGLTNGIKHGKSNAFIFILQYEDDSIRFHLQDNGSGSDKIVYGFGLSAMEHRIRGVGGILSITSCSGEGFSIEITIPIIRQEDRK